MRNLKLLISILFLLGLTQPVIADAERENVIKSLEILLHDTQAGAMVGPESSLRRVVSVMHWNDASGTFKIENWEVIRKNMDSDLGLVASILYDRGFNYSVLHHLRQIIKNAPGEVKYGSVDISQIDESKPAGIPEFMTVNTEQWQTSLTGNLRIQFRKDVYWVIEQMRTMRDYAIYYAGHTPHTPLNLFVNRYKQVQKISEFTARMERSLTQIQSVIASIQIKKAKYSNQPSVGQKLTELEQSLDGELSQFAEGLSKLLSSGQPKPRGDRTPWVELLTAIKAQDEAVSKLEKSALNKSLKAISTIDEITGTSKSVNKYADDEIPELVMQLDQHRKSLQKFIENWTDVSVFTYSARVHKWLYRHKHSEQQMPYMTVEEFYKTRNVGGIELAPIEEETEVADFLAEQSVRITDRRLEAEQIRDIREQLLSIQKTHRAYVSGGPVEPKNIHPNQKSGFRSRFEERNKVLADWIALMIDSTYRHEAHEAKGYVGIELESELSEEKAGIMEKLAAKARIFRNVAIGMGVTAGTGAVGTACLYLLAQ